MAEYYEIRIYRCFDFEKQSLMEAWMRDALIPALGRQGIKNVGVFRNKGDANDHSQFMLIPYASLDAFAQCAPKLSADAEFMKASESWFGLNMKDPGYSRVDSWVTEAFASIPKMEVPSFTGDPNRIYELRLYESHNMEYARRKVKMFDDGETQLMRDTGLGPVFFGRTLAGLHAPNLIYMVGAENEEAHKAHWKTFIGSEGWKGMKDLPEFKDTVSKIRNWFLTPTEFSQL